MRLAVVTFPLSLIGDYSSIVSGLAAAHTTSTHDSALHGITVLYAARTFFWLGDSVLLWRRFWQGISFFLHGGDLYATRGSKCFPTLRKKVSSHFAIFSKSSRMFVCSAFSHYARAELVPLVSNEYMQKESFLPIQQLAPAARSCVTLWRLLLYRQDCSLTEVLMRFTPALILKRYRWRACSAGDSNCAESFVRFSTDLSILRLWF